MSPIPVEFPRIARRWPADLARIAAAAVLAVSAGLGAPARAADAPVAADKSAAESVHEPPYAALAWLADSAPLIVKAEVRKVAVVAPEQAGQVAPGHARLYVEATVLGIFAAQPVASPPSGQVAWLADAALDARGKPPPLKKTVVLAFARDTGANIGGVAQLQLVAGDGQIAWSAAREARLRGIVAELAAPDAPPRITSVRELSYVPADLAGAGESQIFLTTESGRPASITVEHRPGMAVNWSASFSEVVNPAGTPPAHDTLAWYRLACALPAHPPAAANISDGDANKAQAEADYAIVMAELGPCRRGLD